MPPDCRHGGGPSGTAGGSTPKSTAASLAVGGSWCPLPCCAHAKPGSAISAAEATTTNVVLAFMSSPWFTNDGRQREQDGGIVCPVAAVCLARPRRDFRRLTPEIR